ncbi:MAG: hypothetical protein ACWA40_07815 [Planktomarina sp.]
MFKEWGFLLGEIWILLILAALIGLLAGWIIWGRRSEGDAGNAELDACRSASKDKDARIAALEKDLADCQASQMNEDFDGDGVVEGTDEGVKPSTLEGPRDGKADDLKMIKGVGPALEKLCNKLGFYHFDQVAAWTADEVAWVDANLEGFKGRVSRDEWVAQAKILAAGGETEFSKKVEGGGVYE